MPGAPTEARHSERADRRPDVTGRMALTAYNGPLSLDGWGATSALVHQRADRHRLTGERWEGVGLDAETRRPVNSRF